MTIKNVNKAYQDLILKLRSLGFEPKLKDLMNQIKPVLKEQGADKAILLMEDILTNHHYQVYGSPCGSKTKRRQYLKKW